MIIIQSILAAFVGLASGAVVSGAVFAFIAAIGVVPRMAKRTATEESIIIYEEAIIWGGIFGATTLLFNYSLPIWPMIIIILSLFVGIFFGVLAMSLAEVLDVLPILASRIAVKEGMLWFVLAIALGKAVGSLLYFVVSGFHTPGG